MMLLTENYYYTDFESKDKVKQLLKSKLQEAYEKGIKEGISGCEATRVAIFKKELEIKDSLVLELEGKLTNNSDYNKAIQDAINIVKNK